MGELAPPGESAAHRIIEGILERLVGAGNTPPAVVLIDDGSDSWKRHAALLPVEERRRSVVATKSEACLIDAVRFEVGGASWLPVSTPSMETACETAVSGDQRECAPKATRGVMETLVADVTSLAAIGWRPRPFWSRQVGSRRLCAGLTEIAKRLGCVPAILPGPVLVVADRTRDAIEAVCREINTSETAHVRMPLEVLDLSTILSMEDPTRRVEDLLTCVAAAGEAGQEDQTTAHTVMSLFTGERVGGWSQSHEESLAGEGWMAVPSDGCPDGRCWDLMAVDGSRTTVVDVASLDDQQGPDERVIRVPGFIGAELRRGSPAGLLVERWAKHPARAERPLWVPSVDADAVHLLLALPGPIWVDGPGVPG